MPTIPLTYPDKVSSEGDTGPVGWIRKLCTALSHNTHWVQSADCMGVTVQSMRTPLPDAYLGGRGVGGSTSKKLRPLPILFWIASQAPCRHLGPAPASVHAPHRNLLAQLASNRAVTKCRMLGLYPECWVNATQNESLRSLLVRPFHRFAVHVRVCPHMVPVAHPGPTRGRDRTRGD